jgi:hypothetical protein
MRQCGSSVAWTKSKNDVQHHLIQLIWLIKKKNDTQILLMSGRSGVHAATTAVSTSFSSAFTVGGMPLDAGRTRLLHRHLVQRRRRFDANAVIVILGIASVFPFKKMNSISNDLRINQMKCFNLVPSRLVLNPKKTERISLPNDAALTGSNLCSLQCLK